MKKNLNNNCEHIVKSVNDTDWGFAEADTKQLTHEIHRYSGKYIPQIARAAIELITEPEDYILDPYVGSGTTLLEANLVNRKSLGIDLNPLAVLITKVKTTPIDEKELNKLLSNFQELSYKISISRDGQASLLDNSTDALFESALQDSRIGDDWYNKWFNKSILKELLIIDNHIADYPHKECLNVAKVAFSNILRKCSNAHSGFPNVMFDKNKSNITKPASVFFKELNEIVGKVKLLNQSFNKNIHTEVIHGNAKELAFEDNSMDAIVTHPPYIGSVPYAEYGTLSLKWLGHEPKHLDNELTGGKRQSKDVVNRFYADYKGMLSESYRVLKKKKFMFILIGDPTVKGEFIDLAEMTKDLSTEIGFNLVVEKKRTGINRRANKMGPETLFFFQKN